MQTGEGRPIRPSASSADQSRAHGSVEVSTAGGSDASAAWDPCRQPGVSRDDLHACVALCTERFPELDWQLDAWERAYGWLYR